MQRQLVFIPVARTELGALQGHPQLRERIAYMVTDELLDELGYGPSDAEDAEYAALVLASVAALSRYGERLVLVAEVDQGVIRAGADAINGEIILSEVPALALTAWFCDEPGTLVTPAAAAAQGLSIDDAWQLPEVQELLTNYDLLWNDRVEYR